MVHDVSGGQPCVTLRDRFEMMGSRMNESNSLPVYLQDHLAGAVHAIDLLERLRDSHGSDRIGEFAGSILTDVRLDFDVLKHLSEEIGEGSSGIKEIASRLAEKAARIKLDDGGKTGFETFESLEFLTLGVHGKLALWRALEVAATIDVRLQGVDYSLLQRRAQAQEEKIEQERLRLSRTVFRSEPGPEIPEGLQPEVA
jgi:hypothetical protein